VRGWLEDDMRISKDGIVPLPAESSVCIILRHHGDVLGSGIASGESLQPLVDAATLAFKEAAAHNTFSKLSPELKKFACNSISIELEIGTKPTAFPSKNFTRFAAAIKSGVDGVGVRKGNNLEIRLPAMLRLSPGRSVETVLSSLCMNVGVHPAVAISHQLPTDSDVTLYSINTLTGVQAVHGGEIRQLICGDELVEQNAKNSISLLELADILATHLIACTRESGSVIGAYQPETDSLSSPLASPFVQAMVATALQEYAALDSASFKNNARNAALFILNDVKGRFHAAASIPNDVAAAIVIANSGNSTEPFFNTCTKQTIQFAQDITNGTSVAEKPHEFAIVALAVSKIAQWSEVQHGTLAEKLCEQCLTEVPVQSKVSTIPWIVDAVLELRQNGSTLDTSPLYELLNLVIASQIVNNNNPTLLGGFQLASPDGLVADARGVRMLPMLVQMSQLHSSEALRSLVLATRFASQVTTRKERAHRFQNPTMAIGGVRASMSDATMPTEATAMTLIGITRAIQMFHGASNNP
jgi:hypothetical protein